MGIILMVIAVLAALATVPLVLLSLFYISLHEGSDSQPVVALGGGCTAIGFACFVAAASTSRSGPVARCVAFLAAGALFVGGFFAIGSL